MTIDTILFEQFADALNGELAAIGTTLRVSRAQPDIPGTMMVQDASGRPVGPMPDHADATTVLALEAMLAANDSSHRGP